MADRKICIYAICKNEMKFVDAWLNNMSEADYIVVLDTGSTDGTYEYLKEDPRVTKVEQKIYDFWRFDVARNDAMKLVPEDTNIYVSTDFDELFEPGWAQAIRDKWTDETTRAEYTYAWSHNETGDPMNVFKYDKIHNKDYHWIFPVHEVLWPNESWLKERRIDLGDAVYLHHWQDLSVPRKNYMDLLELSVKENPDNPHVRHLYSREFILQGRNEEAYSKFFQVLNIDTTWTSPQYRLVLLDTILMLANLSEMKGELDETLYWCNQFLRVDDTYREPYLTAADVYNSRGQYDRALYVLDLMNTKAVRHYSWVEKHANWLTTDKYLYANAYFGLQVYDKALELYNEVLKHEPNNIDILKHKVACLEMLQKKETNKELSE